jgi:transposase
MEACGSAHHWGRAIRDAGHEVRLIPPAYVKPFVQRQNNDAADAEAIAEGASRPTMRFVAVKTAEQQARAMLFRTRDLLRCAVNYPNMASWRRKVPRAW